jgi:centromere/kinetochore protein ZW10
MASGSNESPLGDTLIQFSVNGRFPEEEAVSAACVENSAIPVALKALNDAQTELEVSTCEQLAIFPTLPIL